MENPLVTIDEARREVKAVQKDGTFKPVRLTAKEFNFLAAIGKENGRVLSRDKLISIVWPDVHALDVDTRTVDQHMTRMRAKLGTIGRTALVTVPNVGYKGVGIKIEQPADLLVTFRGKAKGVFVGGVPHFEAVVRFPAHGPAPKQNKTMRLAEIA